MSEQQQAKQQTYMVLPGFNMGMMTQDDLDRLADLARRHDVPVTKVTGAQRVSFIGLSPDKMAELRQELGMPDTLPHKRNMVHYVQACPGSQWCRFGVSDALAVGERIRGLRIHKPLPYKVKVGVSGCRMCCTEPYVRDVGLIASRKGWTLVFGGNGAGHPRIADVVAERLSDDEAVDLVERLLRHYADTAEFKTRSARYMERYGIESVRAGLGLDKE